MIYRHRYLPLLAAFCAAFSPLSAGATDSMAGQAVVQPTGIVTEGAPAQVPVPAKPLIVIRFNQKRVYFERALRQAVASAEKTRAGVMPSGMDNHQTPRESQNTMVYQQAVINALQNLGIPPARIRTSTGYEPVQSPEVRVFVN
jgi:hypothetical protein